MPVSTFQPRKSRSFTKILVFVIALVGIGLLVYFGGDILKNLKNLKGNSALAVEVFDGDAEVFLNDGRLGETPYESEDIGSGDNTIKIKSDDGEYEVTLNFLPNTQVVINRDLGVSETFSSGQNFWIEKGDSDTVLSVITDPSSASVYIDNTEVGASPYSSGDLTEGEYDLRVEASGYESQTARIKIQKGFKLNVALKLFPMPTPSKVSLLEGSTDLYGVLLDNSAVTSNPAKWVEALVYWNETRGINLSGSGVNKDLVFDYFIDYNGGIYDEDGKKTDVVSGAERGAYLGRISDGSGLTEKAVEALAALDGVVGGKKATILETGTGWLRVRDAAGLGGEEVTTVDVGKIFTVLEEGSGWVKIRVSDEIEGWVSSEYVEVTE